MRINLTIIIFNALQLWGTFVLLDLISGKLSKEMLRKRGQNSKLGKGDRRAL